MDTITQVRQCREVLAGRPLTDDELAARRVDRDRTDWLAWRRRSSARIAAFAARTQN